LNHNDHVGLLKEADLQPGGAWADLGAGSGAFTLALRELIGPTATIYAVDKDRASLKELETAYARRFDDVSGLRPMAADFARALHLPRLDGVLMANSLHFFREKQAVLQQVRTLVKPSGLLLLVEYNVDKGNPWVPFPVSFKSLGGVVKRAGFGEPRLLATHASSFLHEIYSALAHAEGT
jgi:ubiquinone/menaquinone biosynthesis C-methylase UbiE